jgi:hypothetical protein
MERDPNASQFDESQGQYAGFDPSAAERQEGVPAFSDAPDGEDSPGQEATEEQVDYRALYEAQQQETVAERQYRERLEAQQQQLMYQASQAAWKQEAEDARRYANTLDYEPAQKYLADFYEQREQRLMGWAEQSTKAVWINQHADQVIQHYGLTDKDRARLGSDPQQFGPIAESIRAERDSYSSELQETRNKLKRLEQQMAAQGALSNPAYRQGGARPGGAVPTNVQPGSLASLEQAFIQAGVPIRPRR